MTKWQKQPINKISCQVQNTPNEKPEVQENDTRAQRVMQLQDDDGADELHEFKRKTEMRASISVMLNASHIIIHETEST